MIIWLLFYWVTVFIALYATEGSSTHSHQKQFSVVKNSSGDYFLLLHWCNIARKILHPQTVEELVSNRTQILPISSYFLQKYHLGDPVPLLKRRNLSPDEKMRVHIQKILALSNTYFWKQSYKFSNRLNPAIERWRNRTLMIWRPNLYDSNITVAWIKNDFSTVDESAVYAGLGLSVLFPIKIFSFNNMREDPRLLTMSDGSLVVAYTSKESLFEPPKQCYFIGTPHPLTGNLVFNATILLESHDSRITQKNWIPFEYNGKLLFIQSIEPLHIVEAVSFDPLTRRAQLRSVVKIGSSGSGKHTVGEAGTAVSDNSTITRLPFHHSHSQLSVSSIWEAAYGLPIRGGTPAILVRGVYLAFFHTVSKFQLPVELRTYFMGAISFCPRPPFNVHSISRYPIVNESLYSGKWTDSPKIDYVVFPIGLVRDPDKENDFVWLSFGHQDIEGWVVQFELDGLFQSMEILAPCGSAHIPKKRNSFTVH